MRGVEDIDFPNPRLQGRRIRVFDVLSALMGENPNEQFEFWDLEQHKVFGAIQYYWQNKDEFREWLECEREEYEAPSIDEIDDAIRTWEGFGDTVVNFDDAVGTGRDECPECGGSLEEDWSDYSLVCQICGEKYRSEEITVLWRVEDYD